VGETTVDGLLEGEDVLGTAAALSSLGAQIIPPADSDTDRQWRIVGRGVGGLSEPRNAINMGNSGTGARLLMGVVATHPFITVFTGDPSLSARPMARVTDPLQEMGAKVVARAGGKLPVTLTGTANPLPITWQPKVPSAQVKSAILLAGLNTPGLTQVHETTQTRDHTERLLRHFGAEVSVETAPDGGVVVGVTGYPELKPQAVTVPGDISSAAFPLVAALITEGSRLTVENIGINPLRTGLLETLDEMGADIQIENRRDSGGEPVADLVICAGPLSGVDVPAARAASMIDEYPIVAVAAAFAQGTTIMRGLGELRVKESDRLAAIADGLAACGVKVEHDADSLTVHGTGGKPVPGGQTVRTHLDHRIAMSFLILGHQAESPVEIDDGAMIATSFPDFVELMNGLGSQIAVAST
jgi:3-phosphoshikimate 1-carboxyvinyltransferase